MRCPNCGYENIDGVDLCEHCGSDMAGLDLPDQLTDRTTRHFYEVTLADLSPAKPLTLTGEATVGEAIELMRSHRYGAVYIVEDDRLVGIFTERDALKKFGLGERDVNTVALREVMTPNPDSLNSSATLNQALNMMAVNGYRHVPLVDDENRPVGFVSIRGVLNYLHDHVLE